MIYLIHPRLTLGESPAAERFYSACTEELQQHATVSLIEYDAQLQDVNLTAKEDGVVFFNHPPNDPYEPVLTTLLGDGCRSFPVAMSEDLRKPPEPAGKRQSFDIVNELRHRGLDESNVSVIASVLARAVLSELQPTLSQFKMKLFLSHRRTDGEELASWFWSQLRQRAEDPYQDLSEIYAGQEAQAQIEANLNKSDAVIFLDTASAFESEWVAKELNIALALNLPIVWVGAGGEKDGSKLTVRPAATPHLNIDPSSRNTQTVDEVLKLAFALARQSGLRILDSSRRLKAIARDTGVGFEEKSRNELLYCLSIPRKGFRYPQASMQHVVQFYGRRPKDEDRSAFLKQIKALNAEAELGLMLAPITSQDPPSQTAQPESSPPVVVDSGEEYVNTLQRYMADVHAATTTPPSTGAQAVRLIPDSTLAFAARVSKLTGELKSDVLRRREQPDIAIAKGTEAAIDGAIKALEKVGRQQTGAERGGLIISGAFPENCATEFQQDLIDAVHAFARAVFDRGGIVIFGAHPLFVPLIFEMAKRTRPSDFKESVHLYFSKLYREAPGDYADNATVFPIPKVNVTKKEMPAEKDRKNEMRNRSLRKMREAMIQDKHTLGLVAIGGVLKRPGLSIGVDEECELAAKHGIPAFLIGSVQGRSAQLAQEKSEAGWSNKPNTLSVAENEQLRVSLDYGSLADMVLKSIGLHGLR